MLPNINTCENGRSNFSANLRATAVAAVAMFLDKFTELCGWSGVTIAPTVTALQTLLEVCRAYTGPHDIVNNTTKTVCMLVRPKQSQGRYSTRVRLGNEELSFIEKFGYLGHVMTADSWDDKDIKKQFMRQNSVGNMLVGNFSFARIEQKSNCSSHIVTPFMDVLFGIIHTRTLLENLLSVLVTHSSIL